MPYVLSLAFLLSLSFISYFTSQSDFAIVFPLYSIAFATYFFLVFGKFQKLKLNHLIGLAIIARVIMIFSFPNLSDDIYRFIWDGHCIVNGINPFEFIPSELLSSQPENAFFGNIYPELNSAEYYSVYPPLSQLIFMVASFMSGDNILLFSIVLKTLIVLSEILSIYLIIKILDKINLSRTNVLIYALNPLIILEICGNLHFEGFMITFVLLFIHSIMNKQIVYAALTMAAAVAVKLVPLILVPFALGLLGFNRFIKFLGFLAIFGILFFIPIFWGIDLANFMDSLDLYFRRFEFNASIYYLLRFLGFQIAGYNLIQWIGPSLGLLSFVGIMYFAFTRRTNDIKVFFHSGLLAFTIYLLLSTTIHPWYLSMIVILCLFTNFRYPIIWSYLILLTYINYSYPIYQENLWIVFFEYAVVLSLILWEVKKKRKEII